MIYLSGALLILGCAFANRLWGSAWFKGNKVMAVIAFGLTVGGSIFLVSNSYYLASFYGVLSSLLYFFGRSWGHGVFFCCFNPILLTPASHQTGSPKWIVNICDKIVPNVLSKSDNIKRIWGFLGMTIRGAYYFPLIASFYFIDHTAIFLAFGSLQIGAIYDMQYYQPRSWWTLQRQVPVAEYLVGGWLGLLIFLLMAGV